MRIQFLTFCRPLKTKSFIRKIRKLTFLEVRFFFFFLVISVSCWFLFFSFPESNPNRKMHNMVFQYPNIHSWGCFAINLIQCTPCLRCFLCRAAMLCNKQDLYSPIPYKIRFCLVLSLLLRLEQIHSFIWRLYAANNEIIFVWIYHI